MKLKKLNMKSLFKKRTQLRKLPANQLFLPSRMPTEKNHQNHPNIKEKKAADQAKERSKSCSQSKRKTKAQAQSTKKPTKISANNATPT